MRSSIMIPQPPAKRSARRAGNGFTTSNKRKSPNPARRIFQEATGVTRNVIICPASSSITTCPGSIFPKNFSACPAAQTPGKKTSTMTAHKSTFRHTGVRSAAFSAATRPTPTAEPMVPGAMGKYPTPPTVAIQTATVRRCSAVVDVFNIFLRCGPRALVFFAVGFGNPVPPFEPVVQIDQLAAFAAEWAEGISFVRGFLLTDGAPHGRSPGSVRAAAESAPDRAAADCLLPCRRAQQKMIPQGAPPGRNRCFGDRRPAELPGLRLRPGEVVDINLAVNSRRLRFQPPAEEPVRFFGGPLNQHRQLPANLFAQTAPRYFALHGHQFFLPPPRDCCGHLIRITIRAASFFVRIKKHAEMIEFSLSDKTQKVLKIFLGFSGEAHDHRSAQCRLRNRRADFLQHVEKVLSA